MKKSMLKQSVIALMVGAAVSGVSMAADTDPLATATSALKEAIKSELQAKADATKAEQDKKINDIKSKLKELASFVLSEGSEDAPTLAYQLKQLSDKLDNKVDASRVDKIVDELNKISELTDEHGDKFDELKNVLSTLGDRDAELAGKVNDLTGKVSDLESSDDANGQDISDLKEAVFGENGKSDTNGLVKNVEDIANEVDKLKNTQTFQDLEYVKNSIKDVRTKTKDAIEGMAKHLDEAVLPAIEANRTDIDANKADVDTLKNKVAGAAAAVNLLAQNIALNKTNIESKADQDYVEGLERDVKANTSDIKDLSVGIRDHVLPAIEANRTDIDANKADVDTLKNKVAGAAAAVNLLAQNIALNKTNIESKADQDYVEGLERDVKANTSDIKDLSVGIRDHVLPAIEANRSDIDKNASHITDIRNKQALQNARLDNHGERIEANKAAIGDLATATDKAVKNLGDAVRDLDEDLAGTQDAVAENRKDIDKNASRITDTRNKQVLQNARLDNHGERIDANKAAIATNVDKIATNKAAIATNADKIATNADKIATNKAAIATNADKIATNADKIATNADKIATKADKNSVYSKSETDEKFALKADNSVVRAQATDISNLRTDVNAHKVDIDKLRTDVNVHTKRLDHLDNRVNKLDKDLKRGLAAQAALTGLFQPYTVGKANFTAAVGGYKSQTAVAVGTGYRYNQNIATKAGVAFTQGGGVTYNAGVNFEW